MDVTRHNLAEALDILKKQLPTASFAAIDLEFLGFGPAWPSQLDTPDRRYSIARSAATEYPPCEFGISLFRPSTPGTWEEISPAGELTWQVLPFNFSLCLAPVYKTGSSKFPMRDAVFSMQAWCTHFLYQNNFDFNKMFRDGIPWLRRDDEENVREEMSEWMRDGRGENRISFAQLYPDDQMYVQKLEADIVGHYGKGIAATPPNEREPADGAKDATPMPAEREARSAREEVLLCDLHSNPTVRRFVHDLLTDKYPKLHVRVVPSSTVSNRGLLRLQRKSSREEARKATRASRQAEVERSIAKRMFESVGFRHVIDALLEAKVPIVAHNALHDVCKLFGNFIGPLPAELGEFRTRLHSLVPVLIDTKYLLHTAAERVPWVRELLAFKSYEAHSALTNLHHILDSKCMQHDIGTVVIRFLHAESSDWNGHDPADLYTHGSDDQRHQAGFDSFVCGKVFLQLSAVLQGKVLPAPDNYGVASFSSRFLTPQPTAALLNHICLASCGGFTSINLAAPTDANRHANDPAVLVVTGLRAHARTRGIRFGAAFNEALAWTAALFADTPYASDPARFRIVDDDRALVCLAPRASPAAPMRPADLAPAHAAAAQRDMAIVPYADALKAPDPAHRARPLLMRAAEQ